MEYTWDQFRAYSKAVETRDRERNRTLFSLMVSAMRGSSDSVGEVFKTLKDE